MKMKGNNKISGFSLIELMIAIAVVGILASIAYPSYQAHVAKTNRSESIQEIMEQSQFEERFFTEVGRYTSTIPFSTTGSAYNYASSVSATAFTITATPGGSQATHDAQCGVLTINSTGVKCIANGTKCSDSATASVRQEVEKCW